MKLTLKLVATAVALVAAGSANAALTFANTGSSSLDLIAFNTTTNAYYVRDLGYTLNQFLPSSVVTAANDGGATGDKTPAAGLSLNKTTNANFADASFSAWLGAQSASDVRWTIIAGDSLSSPTGGVSRAVLTSALSTVTFTNGQVSTAATNLNSFTSPANQLWPAVGISVSDQNVNDAVKDNFGMGFSTLSSLDQASNVFYFTRTVATGSASTQANQLQFGNPTGFATFKLASNGDVTYDLAGAPAAVPLPAAAWFLGSGVLGLFGVGRRKAKAQAAV